MGWEIYVVAFVVGLLVSSALVPKPQTRPPAALEDIEVPTAEEGIEIPVLFGTRDISGPNVVWFGDFRSEAVRR